MVRTQSLSGRMEIPLSESDKIKMEYSRRLKRIFLSFIASVALGWGFSGYSIYQDIREQRQLQPYPLVRDHFDLNERLLYSYGGGISWILLSMAGAFYFDRRNRNRARKELEKIGESSLFFL